MDNDILDSLQDLGYEGPLLEEDLFEKAIELGTGSVEYTQVVEWTSRDLSGFSGIEDHVNAISSVDDSETFLMELSGFLREFGCPYPSICEGPITERLGSRVQKLQLLDYLLSELQAARMTAVDKPQLFSKAMEVEEEAESATAKQMKLMLMTLGFPKPPEGITPFQLFSKVETKVKELLANIQVAHLSKPLLKARLSDKQWESVVFINKALQQEYECRREMIVKRLDVTIQSFKWSERAKHKENNIAAVLQPVRHAMATTPKTDIPNLLAAREDLLEIEKTSSGAARDQTKCAINRVTIGRVPDRGGRAYEHEIPPPDMPAFQSRQAQPQRQQGGWSSNRRGGRQGRGRGGGESWSSQSSKRGGGDDRGGRGGGRGGGGRGRGRGGDRGGSDRGRGTQRQDSWGSTGGGGSWSAGPATQSYGAPQSQNPATAFFGGQVQGGYQQQAGQYQQQGGYQQQQGGYQQQQQGGYQQGGQQQRGGYQQGGGYNEGGRGGRGRGGRGGRR